MLQDALLLFASVASVMAPGLLLVLLLKAEEQSLSRFALGVVAVNLLLVAVGGMMCLVLLPV